MEELFLWLCRRGDAFYGNTVKPRLFTIVRELRKIYTSQQTSRRLCLTIQSMYRYYGLLRKATLSFSFKFSCVNQAYTSVNAECLDEFSTSDNVEPRLIERPIIGILLYRYRAIAMITVAMAINWVFP